MTNTVANTSPDVMNDTFQLARRELETVPEIAALPWDVLNSVTQRVVDVVMAQAASATREGLMG